MIHLLRVVLAAIVYLAKIAEMEICSPSLRRRAAMSIRMSLRKNQYSYYSARHVKARDDQTIGHNRIV